MLQDNNELLVVIEGFPKLDASSCGIYRDDSLTREHDSRPYKQHKLQVTSPARRRRFGTVGTAASVLEVRALEGYHVTFDRFPTKFCALEASKKLWFWIIRAAYNSDIITKTLTIHGLRLRIFPE